jgi:hypothetical protein
VTARRIAFAVIATLALSSGSVDAQTEDHDYDIYSERWNGLSTFMALAQGSGLRVMQTERIDWEDINRSDVLILLYPTSGVEAAHIAAFIRGGGRVLIGDDFGKSDAVLARLGMLREVGVGVDAARFHLDLAYAPIARPWLPNHPLADGVTDLATNHPAILPAVEGPEVVFGFGSGEAIVAAGDFGNGRFVVTSDPSIFINRMLQFEGNFNFAINLIRFLSTAESSRIVVLAGDFAIAGRPEDARDDRSTDGTFDSVLKDFDNWLEELNEYLLTKTSLRVLAAAFALIVALLAAASLPLARKAKLDGAWIRAGDSAVALDSFEAVISYYDTDDARRNFALPAAVLRDSVNTQLAEVLEHSDPLFGLPETELYARVETARGREAVIHLRAIYTTLKALPTREQAASGLANASVARREFERLHSGAERLYRSLSEPQD